MERVGAAFTANQAAALLANNTPIEIVVNGMLSLSFLLGAIFLDLQGTAFDMLKALHLSNGKLNTTSCQTFFA